MDTANPNSVPAKDNDQVKGLLTTSSPKISTKLSSSKGKPKKPKRNKSAFILFSIEKRAEFKTDPNDHVNSNQMMVKLADSWKQLPKEEKEKYNTKAKNDKLRYLRELDAFSKEHPNENIQNRTKKNHIKKPCSAYAIYLKEMKKLIKKQDPELKMADILKIVSEKWKNLSDPERLIYQERARAEKAVVKARLGQDNILQDSTKINIVPSLPLLLGRNFHQYEGIENQPQKYLNILNNRTKLEETIHGMKQEDLILNSRLAQINEKQNLYSSLLNKSNLSSLDPSSFKSEGPYFDEIYNRIQIPTSAVTKDRFTHLTPPDDEKRLLMNLLNQPMISPSSSANFFESNMMNRASMNLFMRNSFTQQSYPSLIPTSLDTLNTLATLTQMNRPAQNDIIINNIILNALKPENNTDFHKLG